MLGVPQELLDEYGAVSAPGGPGHGPGRPEGAGLRPGRRPLTGVAGPDPDERGNPVGLVYIALAAPEGTWVREVNTTMGRERVRHIAASHGFDLVRRYLTIQS